MNKIKIISVVGARPNFMKIAPLVREMKKHKNISNMLVHTGQHYSEEMSRVFLRDLNLSRFVDLKVGPMPPKDQIKKIVKRFSRLLEKERPDLVIVVGDVNSTLACAISARAMDIKIAHIEAGLRSFDLTMPEEINRIITDSVSDFLFTTEPSGMRNLLKENIGKEKIFFVGNIMIDSLVANIKEADKRSIKKKLGLHKGEYAVLTLHRPSNVDQRGTLSRMVDMLSRVSKKIKVVYPAHPRTVKMLKHFGMLEKVKNTGGLILTPPMGYIDFLSLMKDAKFVMTDSGGMQEETTYLGIPCFTLRENTERPVTITVGTNRLVGRDTGKLLRAIDKLSSKKSHRTRRPELWDGRTARRITDILLRAFAGKYNANGFKRYK